MSDAQDAAYGRLQAMRRDKRARNVPFSDNRRFSAHIRDLVRDGRADEARAKCAEQARPTCTKLNLLVCQKMGRKAINRFTE